MENFNDSNDFNENKLLFSIEINLSNKKTQKINIFSNSNPNKIAYDFSILFNLDFDSHQQLLKKIKFEIEKYYEINNKNSIKKIHISNDFNKKKSNSMKNIFDCDVYNRNIIFLENKNKKLNEIKKELDKSQDEINTFQPKINKISKIAIENRIKNKKEFNNNEIISNYYDYKKEKNQQLFNKFNNIKYSFQPNLKQTNKKNLLLNSKSSKNKLFFAF